MLRFALYSSALALLIASLCLSQASGRLSCADDALPITRCGDAASGTVYLAADLDCSDQFPSRGIRLEGRARLELRGFSITNAAFFAVQCDGSCEIVGPGTLSNSAGGVDKWGESSSRTLPSGTTALSE